MLKKFPSDKINVTKIAILFLSRDSLQFYFYLVILIRAEAQVTVHGIFHVQFCLVFIKVYIFVQQKA